MNDFDKEIKNVFTKEVELSEDFKSGVRNTIEKIQNSEPVRKRNNVGYRFISVIKKLIAAILIGASTITVYAVTTRDFNFSRLGLMKLDENYNDSIVEMEESIENEYVKVTLNSMAGDESYVITEYRINLKDKAISECGEIESGITGGYRLWISGNVFINSNKIKDISSNVTKISDREFVYSQIINIMDLNEKNLDIKIHIDCISLNGGSIKLGKVLELKMNLKDEIKNDFVIQEKKIGNNDRLVISGVGNTKFETYITVQKITENITYKEFKNRDAYKYNSFIVTDKNDKEILYTIRNSERTGKQLYVKDENGDWTLRGNDTANDDEIIKHVENFIILVGNQDNIENVKIIPIETAIFNERTNEEGNEYKKVKWYPLVEGENRYSTKSSLGGTFEITRTEIDDNYVTFYYETEGLIGNESKIIMRKKIKDMNYISPLKVEKAGINSSENKIVFRKDLSGSAGLNVWKLNGMFDNIEDVEFALMWGSKSKIIADAFTVNIPKQNNNIADFEFVEMSDSKQMTIECGKEPWTEKYTITYDKYNKVLSYSSNIGFIYNTNPEYCKDITGFYETVKKFYTERDCICRIIEE